MKKRNMKISGLRLTEMQLQYQHNGFSCGYGKHGKDKYCRKEKHKKDWKDWQFLIDSH